MRVAPATVTKMSGQLSKGIIAALKADAMKHPLITIFVVTEIPQLILMTQFARNQIAQEAGKTLPQLEFRLKDYEDTLKSSGFDFNDAIKANNEELAGTILAGMENTLAGYKAVIDENETWLKEVDSYENVIAIYESYKLGIEANRVQLPGAITGLPENIYSFVRDIIDGDTLDVSLDGRAAFTSIGVKLPDYDGKGHCRVRIVGINAPEKSPKGEIACTDIEIYKVAAKYADLSRDALLPLNDKEVLLKIDPANQVDGYGRLLAVVEHMGVDVGLKQIQDGLACYYFRENHKYVNDAIYKDDMINAKDGRVGMWSEIEKAAPEVLEEIPIFKINIDSVPTNGKLYIDNVYTHHLTPSDDTELDDVMNLLTPGKHTIKVTKAGMQAEEVVEIIEGDNGIITLTLVVAGLPTIEVTPEIVPEVIPEVEPVEEVAAPAVTEYSESERAIAKAILADVEFYTAGAAQLSATELEDLKKKYGVG